jgi:hypothetical protein
VELPRGKWVGIGKKVKSDEKSDALRRRERRGWGAEGGGGGGEKAGRLLQRSKLFYKGAMEERMPLLFCMTRSITKVSVTV